MLSGQINQTGETYPLTDQQLGGTAPEPEERTSAADQASEQAVGAIAVADEPATPDGLEPPSNG